MNGTIAIGAYVISVETAWKTAVLALLTGIFIILGSILNWLTT